MTFGIDGCARSWRGPRARGRPSGQRRKLPLVGQPAANETETIDDILGLNIDAPDGLV